MARKIRMTWVASGASVVLDMLEDDAPDVCRFVWDRLPVEHKSIHGQFSGAEIFILLDNPAPSVPENMCQLPLPGELLYFFDPGGGVTNGKRQASEICFVYNRGVVLRGPEGVPSYASLFARVPGDWKTDWQEFADECRKVRHEGPRILRIERAS